MTVEIASGDVLFFHGGFLPHRIASCSAEPPPHFAHMALGTGLVRLNLQVRPFGADKRHAYSALSRLYGGGVGPSECADDRSTHSSAFEVA